MIKALRKKLHEGIAASAVSIERLTLLTAIKVGTANFLVQATYYPEVAFTDMMFTCEMLIFDYIGNASVPAQYPVL